MFLSHRLSAPVIQASSLSKLVYPSIVVIQDCLSKHCLSTKIRSWKFISSIPYFTVILVSGCKNTKKTANTMFFFRFYAKHKNYLTIERRATNLQSHPRATFGGLPLPVGEGSEWLRLLNSSLFVLHSSLLSASALFYLFLSLKSCAFANG